MPIEFNCPECGYHYNVADAHAGKRTMCKGCGARITVPGQKVGPQPGVPAHPMASTEPAAAPTRPASNARPYGAQAPVSGKPLHRKLNVVLLISAFMSIVGMILPWISWPDYTPASVKEEFGSYISGFELPFVLNSKLSEARSQAASQMRSRSMPEDKIDRELAELDAIIAGFRSLYALLLIPILALLTLADELTSSKKGQNRWWLRILNTLSPVIAFIVIIVAFAHVAELFGGPGSSGSSSSSGSGGSLDVVGIGFWVVCLGAVVSFVSIFTSPKPELDDWSREFRGGPRPPSAPRQPGLKPALPARPAAGPRRQGNPRLPGKPGINRPVPRPGQPPA
ncbi:MAG: hypothetical protein KDB82_04370 [Planctomycetes bacterium]|nr:hypothetical protein [Planctomycetota bacterium]